MYTVVLYMISCPDITFHDAQQNWRSHVLYDAVFGVDHCGS